MSHEKNMNCLILMADDEEETMELGLKLLEYVTGEKSVTSSNSLYVYHTWKIDNKYFTADVKICLCGSEYLDKTIKENAINQLEAAVILFKLSDEVKVEKVKDLAAKCRSENLEISLLFDTDQKNLSECPDDYTQRYDNITQWCIENQFELVQLHQDDDLHQEDAEDKFQEKVGMARVKEALNSHVWSEHKRKGEESSNNSRNLDNTTTVKEIFEGFEQGESFEQLFQKFSDMKEKSKLLEGDAKKEYAAKVALSFMEALGLEEDSD